MFCQLEWSNTFHIRVKDRISSARHRKSLQKAFPIIHGKAKVHHHNTYRKYGDSELMLGQIKAFKSPSILNFVYIQGFIIVAHDVPKRTQKFYNFLFFCKVTMSGFEKKSQTHCDNLDRFLLHTLWPSKFWPLFWLARPQQYLQPLFDIVHEILCRVGVI